MENENQKNSEAVEFSISIKNLEPQKFSLPYHILCSRSEIEVKEMVGQIALLFFKKNGLLSTSKNNTNILGIDNMRLLAAELEHIFITKKAVELISAIEYLLLAASNNSTSTKNHLESTWPEIKKQIISMV